jgi:hypothetical protein
MADSFGIPQLIGYLTQMGLHMANVDQKQEIIELAFHGNNGQWRMIVAIQQSDEVRKLMLIVPHISSITTKKRMECLEALLAVNYRIAMGKFGVDLDDGEVRLEEAVPLANGGITQEQFQLVFRAMLQTVAMYHSLIPRIIYGNLTTERALAACEQDFFQDFDSPRDTDINASEDTQSTSNITDSQSVSELNVHDVLAEVTRMLEDREE